MSERTRAMYDWRWPKFLQWADRVGLHADPPSEETLAEYATDLANKGYAPSTISQAVSAVRYKCIQLELRPIPDTAMARGVIKSLKLERAANHVPKKEAAPLLLPLLRRCLSALDLDTPAGARDACLLTLGFRLMARASTLHVLDIEGVVFEPAGIEVRISRSKTDQEGRGVWKAVPAVDDDTDAVSATRRWLDVMAAAGIASGPLLRPVDRHGNIAGTPGGKWAGYTKVRMETEAIVHAVRRVSAKAGLHGDYRPHSLRHGGAREAYRHTRNLAAIYDQGEWSINGNMPLHYIGRAKMWEGNAMDGVR